MNSFPGQPLAFDPIAAYGRIAKFYHFRTPYGAALFEKLAARVGMHSDWNVLDLCCGTGAVAAGLAPFCKSVEAVDGAAAMIAEAAAVEKVTYHTIDINSSAYGDWIDGRLFDLIAIGMGVHWLGDAVLGDMRQNLRSGGRVAVLATGISAHPHNPWFADFHRIRTSLTARKMQDWTGEARLSQLGYVREDLIEVTYRSRVPVTYLVNHLLSFSQEAENVSKSYRNLVAIMEERLKPYVENGHLECHWISSARLFVDRPGNSAGIAD